MRYPHFLSAARADTQPARLVALECTSRYASVGKSARVQTEHLTGWAGAGWEVRPGGTRRLWEDEGSCPETLWAAVEWTLRRGGRTWFVSRCASRDWGLMGLWDKVDRGEVYFVGSKRGKGGKGAAADDLPGMPDGDSGTVGGPEEHCSGGLSQLQTDGTDGIRPGRPVAGNGNGACGFCVIEDPPTILQARMVGLTGTICAVDLRNYGIDCEPAGATALERARWIRDAMRRMVDTLSENGWGSLCVTAGSQSMFTFRRAFLTHSIHCHNDPVASELERGAYVGGRCGVGRLGEIPGPVYHVDYRSLYPSICGGMPMPCVLEEVEECPTVERLQGSGGHYGYVAQVKVKSDEPAYPYRGSAGVVYPVGDWDTVLAGPELQHAIQNGAVARVYRAARYRMAPSLQSYVRGVYPVLSRARSVGDRPIEQWLKRLLNSLPGKFGQHGTTWKPFPLSDPPERWSNWHVHQQGGKLVRARSLGNQSQIEELADWAPNAVPAIAAWVCSAGRVKLLEAIRCAGWLNVYYYDTDSLIVSRAGYDSLCRAGRIQPGVLGELRLLGKHKTLHVYGQKHYELDGVPVCAGLPRGEARRGPDPATYYLYDWLRRATAGKRVPRVRRVLRKFETRGVYKGGNVGAGGWVYPYQMGDY